MARKKNLGGIIKSFNHWELRKQYDNLCESLFHKYFYKNKDIFTEEEFRALINLEFEVLCAKYNPHRGVDFPGYIKNMLKWNLLSSISKQRKEENLYYRPDEYDTDYLTMYTDKKNLLSCEGNYVVSGDGMGVLTDYDKKLIGLVIKGLTPKEIAQILDMKIKEVIEDIEYLTEFILQEGK